VVVHGFKRRTAARSFSLATALQGGCGEGRLSDVSPVPSCYARNPLRFQFGTLMTLTLTLTLTVAVAVAV
jgi:hypothetical protein